jgi:hypothetical protein
VPSWVTVRTIFHSFSLLVAAINHHVLSQGALRYLEEMPVTVSDVNEPARCHLPPSLQPERRNSTEPKYRALKDNSLSTSKTLLLDSHDPKKRQRAGRLGRLGSAKLGSWTSLVTVVEK